MDQITSRKEFDDIHEDYAFFMEHATEAEADLQSHLNYLGPLAKSGRTIRFLDFGCGDGLFLEWLLYRAEISPRRLILSLVEPDIDYLFQALDRTQTFVLQPVSGWSSLPPDLSHKFDLILVNHVLYYVNDLAETLGQLIKALAMGGLLLISMGGRKNTLCDLVDRSFASLREPVPYHLSEDLEAALEGLGQNFQKHRVQYELNFPDIEDNRLKMIRFMLGEHFTRMDRGAILKLFDPYTRDGRIVIQTWHYQYVLRKGCL
jgi:trans-aconitate 2-methyltransferase